MNRRVEITKELQNLMELVLEDEIVSFQREIKKANRIFLAGMGRSGFMMRGFAMRLMHMGFDVFVVGETTTPAILKHDLLIIGSGSGETSSLVSMAKSAKKYGANIALITTNAESSIAKLADAIIVIKAQAKGEGEGKSIQPMGTLFEQGLLVLADSIVLDFMNENETDGNEMFKSWNEYLNDSE